MSDTAITAETKTLPALTRADMRARSNQQSSGQSKKPARTRRVGFVVIVALLAGSLGLASFGVTELLLGSESTSIRHELENVQAFNDPNPVPVAVSESEIPTLAPNLVVAPSVGLHAPLVSMGLDDRGDIAISSDAGEATLFTESVPLGSLEGSTLIAGHVTYPDSGAYAPMSQIVALRPGDLVITLDAAGHRTDWRVTRAEVVARDGLRAEMWAPTGPRQLVLITCAGETGQVDEGTVFTDNLVVTAVPDTSASR